jgi:hypothetical protein
MPDNYVSVETDGLQVSSNSETQEEMQEILGVTPEKPPEGSEEKTVEKPPEKPKEKVAVDSTGREHDEKGRFKAKPIPDKPKTERGTWDAASGQWKEQPKEAAKAEESKGEVKEEKPPEKAEEEKKKSRPGRLDARQRVEQATRAAAELRRSHEAALRENEALRQALGVKKEAEPAKDKPQDGDGRPELTEGKDPVEFVREMSEWAAQKAQREADQKREQQEYVSRYQQEAARREETFAKAMGEYGKQEPDFTERIDPRLLMLTPTWNLQEGEQPSVWNAIADEVAASSLAPQLLIHLTEHEDELQRLATLRPRELTRAMAKMEAKLEAAKTGTPAPEVPPYRPSAAEPVTPVTGAATTAEGPPDENAPFEVYAAYWNKKDREKRRA